MPKGGFKPLVQMKAFDVQLKLIDVPPIDFMICKWGRHFDVVRLNLQLNSLQQAHLQNDQIDQITKQGLALPCALNTIFSHISQCIIICLRMSVLKPGTTATLSGFTTLSNRFRQQCHVNFRMSSQGSQSIAHAALHSALHRQISCPAVEKVLEAAAGSHFQHQQSTSYCHTDLYYASLNVLLPRSLSFLLLFLLVEAHVGLWAPCRQQ